MISICRLNWLKRDPTVEAPICYGTDPDRNYNVEWRKHGSASACSELYAGPKALSEPETRALASFLDENRKELSVSSIVLIPPKLIEIF